MLKRSLAVLALGTAAVAGCGGPAGSLPTQPLPTISVQTVHRSRSLTFLVRQLGIMDGTSVSIKTGFSFKGLSFRVKVLTPQSGLTAHWGGGVLKMHGKCPSFTPASDILLYDSLGDKGTINVACVSIPSGTTSYASPFSMIVLPKAHQDVSVYGLGQPIVIQPHDDAVSSVSRDVAKTQFTITARAVGQDGVSFEDHANPPNTAGVTVTVVKP